MVKFVTSLKVKGLKFAFIFSHRSLAFLFPFHQLVVGLLRVGKFVFLLAVSEVDVDDVDRPDSEDVVISLDPAILLDFIEFLSLLSGDGVHILKVVDVDIDKGVSEKDDWSFIVEGYECVRTGNDEDNHDENAGKDHEDVAPPQLAL